MTMDTVTLAPTLRLNQGDASERRIYYLAHFVADGLGLFEAEGVSDERRDRIWKSATRLASYKRIAGFSRLCAVDA